LYVYSNNSTPERLSTSSATVLFTKPIQELAKDSEVRGKPVQYHTRRIPRKTKTAGKATENLANTWYVRLWVCSRTILRCRHATTATQLEYWWHFMYV